MPRMCDVATLMFAAHEMPRDARRRVLANAMRISHSDVYLVDICPSYIPSHLMLLGEPFLLDYQREIEQDVCVTARDCGQHFSPVQ